MIRNELSQQSADVFNVVEDVNLITKVKGELSYTEILAKEKLKVVEHRMKHKMNSRTPITDQKVMCVACGLEHYNSERLKKSYGLLDTNHCPHCNCEGFWKL